jgi:hypothetical protein
MRTFVIRVDDCSWDSRVIERDLRVLLESLQRDNKICGYVICSVCSVCSSGGVTP